MPCEETDDHEKKKTQNNLALLSKLKTLTNKKIPITMKSHGQVVYLMFNYIESLFTVFKKNICPWATYPQVEQAVFFYILNVIHKCESIMADQLELKLIEADIKEY